MTRSDPIVEETRMWRQEYALKFNHDLDLIFEDARRRQAESGKEFVTFPPRKPRPKLASV